MSEPPHPSDGPAPRRWLPALGPGEGRFLADVLRQETVGGALLLAATVVAIVWANSPAGAAYENFQAFHIATLSLQHWAADGGLAVFFFIAGLELKRELTVGSLSTPVDALVPVAAAIAGMIAPALIYLALNASSGDPHGWAVPMATDIAFALAVLAVAGRALPSALRAFLLTLAVVDDLGAILVIAVVFTADISTLALAGAVLLLIVYGLMQRAHITGWWIYLPIAGAAWWLMLESGVHATIAGVALGLLTRVRQAEHETTSPAELIEHRLRPVSAGVAVPFFALMSAGVAVSGGGELLRDPVVLGVVLGLVLGKTIGVLGGAWVVARLTRAELSPDIGWRDVGAAAVLSGIGFTVSLLIAELAFTGARAEAAKTAVLAGSLLAGLAATALLRVRNRHHRSHGAA